MSSRTVTRAQACVVLGITTRTMSRYLKAGIAPASTLTASGHRVYEMEELDRWYREAERPVRRVPDKDPATGQFLPKA